VDAAITRAPRRLLVVGLAVSALGFIVVMAFTGAPRERQDRVRFEPAGVMREPPGEIDRVELWAGAQHMVLVRHAGGTWTHEGEAMRSVLASHLETSLRFMHVAAPMRVLQRADWDPARPEEFGLEPPRYTVVLSRAGQPVLTARFGSTNPQQVGQYIRIEGRDELYLIPAFVGREWERVLDGIAPR
jgi:Domain of unknown function (DUF4340)